MIYLNVSNNICYLQSDSNDFTFRSLLNNNLTVYEKVRVYSRGRGSKQFRFNDVPVPLYTVTDKVRNLCHFPRGLYTLLNRQMNLYDNSMEIIDNSTDDYRISNDEITSINIADILKPNASFSLRPDQILAVMKSLYHKRGILQMPTGCFTGDTKIRLLNGTVKSFEELIDEGISDFDVISMTSDGEVVPGRAHNPHITKYVDKLVEITLDDNSKIRCTPEHKFMLRDGTYERAENLTEDTSLMPHYSSIGKTNKDGSHGTPMSECIWTYVPKYNEYQQLHRIVSDKVNGIHTGHDKNIHHKDGNKLNNSTDNLELLPVSEHCRIHALEYHRNHPDHAADTLGRYIKEHPEHQSKAAKSRRPETIDRCAKRLAKYNSESHPRLRKDITVESVIEALESSYDIYEVADKLKCSRTVIYSRLGKAGLNYRDYLKKRNHKVKSVNVIELAEKIPVYDIEVDEYHNFAIETGDMSGVIVHNSGKTEVMAAIITILESKFPDIKVTVIEPTDVLVNKTTERFNRYDLNAVRYKDIRYLDNPNFNVLVAHPQSLLNDSSKDPTLLDNMIGVFWDECQHCKCDTWKTLNERLKNCEYALGFSALAVSEDHIYESNLRILSTEEVLIEGATGPVIVNISPKYYIENDILATPVILQLTNRLGKGLYGCNDWSKLRQKGIESEDRTNLTSEIVDMFNYYDRRVLILVGTKKQAYAIASRLALEYDLYDNVALSFGAGESLLVDHNGKTRPYDGEDIVSDFDNGRFSILISTSHMDEGVDLSNLDVAVLASGGKKDRRVVQRIGRALRNNKTGKYAYIVDFYDEGSGVLQNHSNLRMKLYTDTIQVPKDLIFRQVSSVESFRPYFEALEGMVDLTPSAKLMDKYNHISKKKTIGTTR